MSDRKYVVHGNAEGCVLCNGPCTEGAEVTAAQVQRLIKRGILEPCGTAQPSPFTQTVEIQAPGRMDPADLVAAWMEVLTPEQRMGVMRRFCRECGGDDPRCTCMRDE
jgi:hypothetical protein